MDCIDMVATVAESLNNVSDACKRRDYAVSGEITVNGVGSLIHTSKISRNDYDYVVIANHFLINFFFLHTKQFIFYLFLKGTSMIFVPIPSVNVISHFISSFVLSNSVCDELMRGKK